MVEQVKEEAMSAKSGWTEIGTLSDSKKAAAYKTQSFTGEIDGRPYRLIVVHSTSLDTLKQKTLAKRWEKQKEGLEKDCRELAGRDFACEADALKAIDLFVKKHKKKPFVLTGAVNAETVTSYPTRGRPRKGSIPESMENYHALVTVEESPEAMEHERERASLFVLLTNLLDAEEYPDVRILREYKEQNAVEQQFRFLKQPFILGPVYLKNKNRVEAMSFIFQLALLVAAYLAHRVRMSLKEEDRPLTIWDNRKTTKPSARALMEMCDSLVVVKHGQERQLANCEGPETLRVLDLAGFGKRVYLKPSGPFD